MAVKTVLAYLPDPASAPAVLQAVKQISSAHRSHVIGLHLAHEVLFYSDYPLEVPQDVIEKLEKNNEAITAQIKSLFQSQERPEGVSYEWSQATTSYLQGRDELTTLARSADLMVCAKAEPGGADLWIEFPEIVMMSSGRPILLVPSPLPTQQIGRNVIIAWNNTRESARAMFDAIDLMREAEKVRLVSFVDSDSQRRAAKNSLDLAVATLVRHGIPAAGEVSYASKAETSESLMSSLIEEGCDLLVMGGYGHSQLREMIFGGVSRDLLRHIPVPTLISH
jgi:nucleotide-binding universal stress UspA family protein